jgi:2-keto-myo-inositol isomerase
MLRFALNHMTVAGRSFAELIEIAAGLGCVGVEARNDLSRPLFDGLAPEAAAAALQARGLRLLALAEVKRFNDWSAAREAEALALARLARAAGAEALALIPRNDNGGMGNGERQAALRVALKALRPILEDHGLLGYVEPLGFAACALRHKAEAVEAIEALGARATFRLVHDSFHHHLAGGGPVFPEHTAIVHVSGVAEGALAASDLQDRHRLLVDGADRLGTVAQLAQLRAAGWQGPVSFECFAPEIHRLADPAAAVAASLEHIRAGIAAKAA